MGESSALPLGAKAHAMLVYLAEMAPKPVAREVLVELLWERVAPAQGKSSLRQEIRRLKRALGDADFAELLDVSDRALAMRPEAVFYDGAEALRAAEARNPNEIAPLMTICDGDFLASNTARAESFQQWAAERRGFYTDLALASLARLGVADLEAGRLDRAQMTADRMATIDPLHEKGAEIMIRVLLASGRPGQARAHFLKFRKLLLGELGAEPDKGIAALVAPEAEAEAESRPAEPNRAKPERAGGDRPVVAVLNVTPRGENTQKYLSDGVAEQLVFNLSRSAWIRVAALNAAPFTALGGAQDRSRRDVRETADYVLRVDVRVAARKVAITSTLSRVSDNETVFSDQMEDGIEDILDLQRRVALRIASIFEPILLGAETRREAGIDWGEEPDNVDHWRLLMRANWLFWSLTPGANAEAWRLLNRALKIRPDDPPTLCMLAFSRLLDAWSDWTDDVDASVRDARRWAEKAARQAPNDGWSQFTLGVASSTADRLTEAKDRVLHALRRAPSLVIAIGELARLHAFDGETRQAKARADEALALSPYDPQAGLWIRSKAIAVWIEGDLQEALKLIDHAMVVRPGWFQNHVLRAAILAELDREDEARASFAEAREKVGDYSFEALRFGHPFSDEDLFKRFIAALNRAGGDYEI